MSTPAYILTRAAERLEELALRASDGPWYASPEPMRPTYKYDVGTAFDIDDQDTFADVNTKGDADWIAAMSPAIAVPLITWLRDTAKYMRFEGGAISSPENGQAYFATKYGGAIAFAKRVLGEA